MNDFAFVNNILTDSKQEELYALPKDIFEEVKRAREFFDIIIVSVNGSTPIIKTSDQV